VLAGTPSLKTGEFRWSKVLGLLRACLCRRQLVHSDCGEDAIQFYLAMLITPSSSRSRCGAL